MSQQQICAVVPALIGAGKNDLKAPKFEKNSWAKTMKDILLHLKLVRDGDSIGQCDMAPHQDSTYLTWIWCLLESS